MVGGFDRVPVWPGLASLMLAACAGSQEGTSGGTSEPEPAPPLTREEAERALTRHADQVRRCYRKHWLSFGLDPLSSYVVRLQIPNDGQAPVAEVVEATQGDQEPLETCILAELQSLRFRAFSGQPLILDVPIRAPKR